MVAVPNPPLPVVAPAQATQTTALAKTDTRPNPEPKIESATTPPPAAQAPPLASAPPVVDSQTAVAVPTETLLGQRAAWFAGILLAGAAAGLGFFAVRRSRAAPRGSLITRSLDRKIKRKTKR
jgi:hypothetical protein